jgi:hypothetical protein
LGTKNVTLLRRRSRWFLSVQAASEKVPEQAPAPTSAVPSNVQIPKFMNSTPHPREMRRFFYKESADSVLKALAAGCTRMKVRCTVPELNPEMDVYRVGTLLEWVREIATEIAEDGKCASLLCIPSTSHT